MRKQYSLVSNMLRNTFYHKAFVLWVRGRVMTKKKRIIRVFLCFILIFGLLGPKFGNVFAKGDGLEIEDTSIFPDARFRAVLHEAKYDRNQDGYLDDQEILYLQDLRCEKEHIKSLKGIENFWNLKGLYCRDNEITEWDISHNKELIGIWCSGNKFESQRLDFSGFSKLEWVYCYDCNLKYLNVSNNSKLSYLETSSNYLSDGSGLDVTNNLELEHLICGDNGLSYINLRNNKNLQHLDIQNNKFTTLDLSQNTLMKRLDIWGNPLGNYDVSHMKGLQYYNCAMTGATKVDVSQNTELTKLSVAWNYDLPSLDVSKNTKLVYLDCCDCNIGSLDISHNPQLHFLQAFFNPFDTLDIGNNPFLIKTYNEGQKKSEPNAAYSYSWSIDFGGEDSTSGDSLYFLCYDNEGNNNNTISAYRHQVKLITTGSGNSSLPDKSKYDNVTDGSNLITRGMAVEILYEIAGSPGVDGLNTRFTDVKPGCWYEKAVIWGEQFAMCMGYPYFSDTTFDASKYLSREDLCYLLMRYAEVTPGYKREIDFGRSDEYKDYFEIDYDHWEAICWAATWHIVEGKGEPGSKKSEQYFDPHGKVTRAEFKEAVRNFLEENGDDPNAVAAILAKADTTPVYDDASNNGSNNNSNNNSNNPGKWEKQGNDYYYYDGAGNKETNCYREGCWLGADGKYDPAYTNGCWKSNSTGWWYEDNGWYPVSQWLKIDGKWYYFLESGYMDYSEYRDGCWLGSDGAWVEEYYGGHWCNNSTGWWYEDASGWYPHGEYVWIDGVHYYFNDSGYWAE